MLPLGARCPEIVVQACCFNRGFSILCFPPIQFRGIQFKCGRGNCPPALDRAPPTPSWLQRRPQLCANASGDQFPGLMAKQWGKPACGGGRWLPPAARCCRSPRARPKFASAGRTTAHRCAPWGFSESPNRPRTLQTTGDGQKRNTLKPSPVSPEPSPTRPRTVLEPSLNPGEPTWDIRQADAGRTIEFKGTHADRTRAQPFPPPGAWRRTPGKRGGGGGSSCGAIPLHSPRRGAFPTRWGIRRVGRVQRFLMCFIMESMRHGIRTLRLFFLYLLSSAARQPSLPQPGLWHRREAYLRAGRPPPPLKLPTTIGAFHAKGVSVAMAPLSLLPNREKRLNTRPGRVRGRFSQGSQDTGAGVARAWRGRGAGCTPLFAVKTPPPPILAWRPDLRGGLYN
eukprot:gene22594-biopygen8773